MNNIFLIVHQIMILNYLYLLNEDNTVLIYDNEKDKTHMIQKLELTSNFAVISLESIRSNNILLVIDFYSFYKFQIIIY